MATLLGRLFSEALKRSYRWHGILPQIYGHLELCFNILLYGEGFHIFKPDVPADNDEYDLKTLMKHPQVFGPFPRSYDEVADQERRAAIVWIMQILARHA
ncbi:hypothetical protein BDV29DRAFT_156342 [Aspergillus leporis]|uniref:Uncharacterized protein n=1 Tax=Aspergillus leporis TaxID=41062 RepID=A0A5N5X1Y5_9EURO|nr:hypothetical protein BDV29DRAFT_156342 [Aspergillus leporis]